MYKASEKLQTKFSIEKRSSNNFVIIYFALVETHIVQLTYLYLNSINIKTFCNPGIQNKIPEEEEVSYGFVGTNIKFKLKIRNVLFPQVRSMKNASHARFRFDSLLFMKKYQKYFLIY